MKYPKELVNQYGAKAGILMYVADKLPDIPQVDMVVKTPDESIEDALKRADKFPILYPRLFRSSAIEELLGYEGFFPTKMIEDFEKTKAEILNPNYCGPYSDKKLFDEYVRNTLEWIENCPASFKEQDKKYSNLPDKICVIIAEQSPSSYFGTYIKHPNRDGFYIISITDADSKDPNGEGTNPIHKSYSYDTKEGIKFLEDFTISGIFDRNKPNDPKILKDLETVISWHDRITALPLIDSKWIYQIEFGIDPPCLYQVRPFKPVEKADFKVKSNIDLRDNDFVIGITSKKGIKLRVEEDLWKRYCNDEEINPRQKPSIFIGK